MLVPSPTYPLYTAVLAKIGAQPGLLPHRSGAAAGCPTSITWRALSRRARARSSSSIPTTRPARSTPRQCGASSSTSPSAHGLVDPGRRGLRRSRLRRPGAAAGGAGARRRDHLLLEPVEGLPGARLARRLDGGRRDAAARRRAGGDQEARRRPAVQPGADAVRGRRRRSPATARIRSRSAQALRERADLTAARFNAMPGMPVRGAAGGVLRDAAGDAAAGQDRRGLRARPAARHGHPLRARLGLRPAGRRRLLPRRVPGVARRARRHLRRRRRLRAASSRRPDARERRAAATPDAAIGRDARSRTARRTPPRSPRS